MQSRLLKITLIAGIVLACSMLSLAANEETEEIAETEAPEEIVAEPTKAPTPAPPKIPAKAKPTRAPVASGAAPLALTDSALQNAIKDRRYMMHQIKCTLGEGPCDSVGRKLKALAPLVMKNICFQCTPAEKRQIQIVASHIQRNFPAEWSKIVRQYGST